MKRLQGPLLVLALAASALYAFVLGRSYSDLHPVWSASRAFDRGADAYSSTLAADEERLFHSQVPGNTTYDLRFVYPLPALLPLAPLGWVGFTAARVGFTGLCFALTLLSLWCWRGEVRVWEACLVLALWPVMVGISIQQPTMWFAPLLAGAYALLRSGRAGWAGVLLAVACGKPQLLAFVAAPVALHAVRHPAQGRKLVASFGTTLTILLGGCFLLQPGWVTEWRGALRIYATYAADNLPTLQFGRSLGAVLTVAIVAAGAYAFWRQRDSAHDALCVSLCTAVLVAPFHDYNEVLLVVPLLHVFRSVAARPVPLPTLIARGAVVGVLAFPVLACAVALVFPRSPDFALLLAAGLERLLAVALFACFLA